MHAALAGVLVGAALAAGTTAAGVAGPVAAPAVAPAAGGAAGAATSVVAAGAAVALAPAAVQPQAAFGWPLPGFPAVLRRFEPPEHPYGPGHRGVDLGGWAGQPVLAAGAGVVAFAGMVAGRPVLSVDHANGLRTTYEPVLATVSPGQRVDRGQPIGILQAGHPGCPTAACLHWGVRRGAEYLDPLRLLSPGRVRLLPNTAG